MSHESTTSDTSESSIPIIPPTTTSTPLPNDPNVSFQMKLICQMAQRTPLANFIISPLAVRSSLTLAAFGASGAIATEVLNCLHYRNAEQAIVEHKRSLNTTAESEFTFHVSNAVFANTMEEIVPHFKKIAKEHFNALCENLSFADTNAAADTISTWLEQQTSNIVPIDVSSDSLPKNTALLLFSTSYFQAQWHTLFPKQLQLRENFWVSPNRHVEVDMMYSNINTLHGNVESLDATAVSIPYGCKTITMLVLMPTQQEGLQQLERKLDGVDLTQLTNDFSLHNVRLGIPKFQFWYDAKLKSVMQALGINRMFSHSADFPLMCMRPVSVTQMRHVAMIHVDEGGTEISKNKVSFDTSRLSNGDFVEFSANRPFFFAIVDDERVYYAGHVVDF